MRRHEYSYSISEQLSQLKGTVSRDFRTFCIKKNSTWAPYMNRQKRFRESFRFREDIRENSRKKGIRVIVRTIRGHMLKYSLTMRTGAELVVD